MPTVKITESNGRVIEVSEVTVEDIKRIISPNGNGHAPVAPKLPQKAQPDFTSLKSSASDHVKKFLQVVAQHKEGISADNLCEKMGFNSTNQIGGVTGGGLSKLANRFHIPLTSLYTVEKKFEHGERKVIYWPGPEIEKVL